MNTLSIFNPAFASDVFDAFDRGFGYNAPVNASPRVDVRETVEAYLIDMDLPGYSESDIELSLKDRVLTIASAVNASKGEKKEETKVEYLIHERRENRFARRFTLPNDIDAEKVEANFRNGVLTVSVPRKPETQPRQILIKTA